jgi:hypothetical protein
VQNIDFKNVIKQTEKEGVVSMSTSVLDQLIAESVANTRAEGEAKMIKFGQDTILDVLRTGFRKFPLELKLRFNK